MRRPERILYVDDDPDIALVVKAALSRIGGFEVQLARSGAEAIELALSAAPDLILMDVMMPRLDGPSAFKRMRADPRSAGIPVMFLTAKILPTEVNQLLDLGAIGVIGKPFDPATLAEEILARWALKGTSPDASAPPAPNGAPASKPSQAPAARPLRACPVPATPIPATRSPDAIRSAFLERARRDAARLQALLEAVQPGNLAALREVEHLAHELHGSAAIFGFPTVSVCGGAIEELIESLAARRGVKSIESTLLEQLIEYTERLVREIETVRPKATPETRPLPLHG